MMVKGRSGEGALGEQMRSQISSLSMSYPPTTTTSSRSLSTTSANTGATHTQCISKHFHHFPSPFISIVAVKVVEKEKLKGKRKTSEKSDRVFKVQARSILPL